MSSVVQIKCPSYSQAENVCLNGNCNQFVFLCKDKLCDCFRKHKGCIKGSIQSITQALQQKIISTQPLEKKLQDLIEHAINDLSNFRDKILTHAKDNLNYLGLTKNERKFMKAIKKGETNDITGKQMHEINLSIINKVGFEDTMQKVGKKVDDIWDKFTKEVASSFKCIQGQLSAFSKNYQGLFNTSLVVKDVDSTKKILNFFSKKVVFSTLLYRASQNQFKTKKFFQNCKDLSDTIVICETQYGKIIGGYTPLKWEYYRGDSSRKDDSGEPFVFSLTNNDKFQLRDKNHASRTYSDCGPMFGGGNGTDLFINNDANNNKQSGANIMNAYYNSKYTPSNKDSWLKFSGSSQSFNFAIKQWQVWRVQFNN